MKPIITSARIRAILSDAHTERDITDALRAHRIRYGYSTEGGYTHIRIPFRSGCIRVYRAVARSAPVVVTVARSGRSAPVVPVVPIAPARSVAPDLTPLRPAPVVPVVPFRSAPPVPTPAPSRSAPAPVRSVPAPIRSVPAPVSLRSRSLPRSSFVPASSPERLWPAYY